MDTNDNPTETQDTREKVGLFPTFTMKSLFLLPVLSLLCIHQASSAWIGLQGALFRPQGILARACRGGSGDKKQNRHGNKLLYSISSAALPVASRRYLGKGLQAQSFKNGETKQEQLDTNRNTRGVVYMALSSLSFSLMFLGVKLYSNAPTFTLVFYRSIVQAILAGIGLLTSTKQNHTKESFLGTANVRGLLVLRGLFGSLAVAAFFYAVQCLPLPDAITLQFTTPVFAAILAVPLLNEKLTMSDLVGAVVCMAGVLLIARPSWLFGAASAAVINSSATSTTATLVGLLGAMLAAIAYILVRRIGDRASANVMVLYYAVISAFTAPMGAKLLSSDTGWNVMGSPSMSEFAVLCALGLFGFAGQLLTNMGLTSCNSAATATLVTNIQIVFAFLFEFFLLQQPLSFWSLAGSGLIASYMAWRGLQIMRKGKKNMS